MKFSFEMDSEDNDNGWLKENIASIFQTLVFAIVVLLVLITVIRPIALKAFEIRKINENKNLEAGDNGGNLNLSIDEKELLDFDMDTSERSIDYKASFDMLNKVKKVVDSNPQDLLNVLRKWLNEGG